MVYSGEHHELVRKMYVECEGNASGACRRLAHHDLFPNSGPSLSYVKNRWRKEGFALRSRGGKQVRLGSGGKRGALSDFERLDTLVNYYINGGNATWAGKNNGYHMSTYIDHWKSYREHLKEQNDSTQFTADHFESREATAEELDRICAYLGLTDEDMVVES